MRHRNKPPGPLIQNSYSFILQLHNVRSVGEWARGCSIAVSIHRI